MELLVDLHTHTTASGHAYSTITENALAASRRGIKLLGMTDHGPSMPGAPPLYHFDNLSVLPEELYGVRILPGVEANIINFEGELDMPLTYLRQLKLILVGLHPVCYPGGTCEENTQAYIKAMENPYTDMMVHPGRPDFSMDLERIAYVSAELNIPVEINNSSLSTIREKGKAKENCRSMARYMAKYHGPVILGSDAHFWDRVGEFSEARELILETGISEDQILNTSPERVLDYLSTRRKRRSDLNTASKYQLSIA
ncbi:PHP family phosphohydrolase, histidinol phosphatase [Desulfosporosinus orientis DSM 765]|uniref:PHP family phosphohydrolase, histidinol phosphatase n=1 Tax=Desulfosporosinus orientis (strain ATCC 19365 / DSM 765 / NCIMB 8382 / VKM B-1628 / Singapore I) TaxID=768706 RepID=G7WE45_DESOD|nr:phosphatase [Desulfosporosinus orientis]AET69443.1 PHP family phosphohydrolase, histidinol phosphatase [Desulfosporosinus orientis DSM 765]